MDKINKVEGVDPAFPVSGDDADGDRRRFLRSAGRFALVVPPTMTLLLSTTMNSSAIAKSGHVFIPEPKIPPDIRTPEYEPPTGEDVPDEYGGGTGGGRLGGGGYSLGGRRSRVALGSPVGGPPGSEGVLGAPSPTLDEITVGPGLRSPRAPSGIGHPPTVGDAILNAGERG